MPELSLVVPVFNEESSIPIYLEKVREVLKGVGEDYEIIFAMDPSTDRTEEIVTAANREDGRVKLLKFSRRFGQPGAIWGGLAYSTGRAVIVMDVDLQDPPEVIADLVAVWREGKYKVAIPQRRSREGDNIVKRIVAYCAYWFINKTAIVEIPRNCGDFRLLDREVVTELLRLKETNAFLRGLTAVVGYKYKLVPFDRKPRAGGEGKYFRFTGGIFIGFNGVIAFSGALLRLMTFAGFIMAGLAIVAALVLLVGKVTGWYQFATGLATLAVFFLFLTGCQFVGMGILGAYIGRIYEETKRRPIFIVEEAVGFKEAQGSLYPHREPERLLSPGREAES
ncbi:MAG: glycosyltransferase family 2 protein [Deltaproteobacteria bacterium]|jgi:dolichol-phosphate mannosyltransferase|nr:glycosyltransferase family 2 protein [Deltaproteobacteria bacterium]